MNMSNTVHGKRTGKLKGNAPVQLNRGDEFLFLNDPEIEGDNTKVCYFLLYSTCSLTHAHGHDRSRRRTTKSSFKLET